MILFVCSQGFIRSRTAEILAVRGGALDVRSAGTDHNAPVRVGFELIRSAEQVFCMEDEHRKIVNHILKVEQFDPKYKEIIVLNIKDQYERFNTDLVDILFHKIYPFNELVAEQIKIGAESLYADHPHFKKSSQNHDLITLGFRGQFYNI